MHAILKSGTILAAALALGSTGALAQNNGGNNGNGAMNVGQANTNASGGNAQGCRNAMTNLVQKMRAGGLWISGWGTPYGYGYGPAAPVAGLGVANTGNGGAPANVPANGGGAAPNANGGNAASNNNGNAGGNGNANNNANANGGNGNNYSSIYGPFYSMGTNYYGYNSPRAQFETLYAAANILANDNQTAACESVVKAMQARYQNLRQLLQKAGINANQIGNWRELRIAQATPVRQLSQQYPFSTQSLIGLDVRNLKDKVIGTVSNIAFNPKTGNIGYLVVGRGGFLGIADEHVGVPWARFRATPGLNLLVLNATEQQLADAPQINTNNINNPSTFQTTFQQVKQYWQKQASNNQAQNRGGQNQNQNGNQ
jgi:sporulation protein YlmC with PRC-barrel domain